MKAHAGHQGAAIVTVTSVESGGLRLQIVSPPPDLAPYISLYYRTDVAPGHVVEDLVPPELANLRTGNGAIYEAAIGSDAVRQVPEIVLAGPTSRSSWLRIGEGQYWGIGLLPLGFAKFLGVRACEHADRFSDIAAEPAARHLRPMLEDLVGAAGAIEEPVALMNDTFRSLLDRPVPQADAIMATHKAIVSDLSRSVASVAAELRTSTRTLERFCRRNFGFTPQMLLRRQRFLRSLASFMLDPTMKWIDTIDGHYHDQAHFVRDFHFFMGMTPRDYGAADHPITGIAVRARSLAKKQAMQVLHEPTPPPVEAT